MSHEVESMAFVGERPWHQLGFELTPDSTIEEWTVQAGLDWEVSKRPVMYTGDVYIGESNLKPFKDRFVLARTTDDKPYAVVSGRYKPVQPKQILEFFRDLVSNFGMTIETAGTLRDGKRVWALAKTGQDTHKVMGVDEVNSYLMLATSYDLTFSTLAQFTSIRVVCNNTLQMSFRDFTGRVTIPHFRDFDADAVKNELKVGREQWGAYTQMLDTLATIKLDVAKASSVLHKAYDIEGFKKEDERAVAIGHVAKIIDLFSGKAIGADIAGATGWGLVNATTEYLDQHKRARSASNRLDAAWFGDSFNTKQAVVDATLELAA